MDIDDKNTGPIENTIGSIDLEKLLEEKERLDAIIKRKFTRNITIMFTDMKGSTSFAEEEGDVASRFLIKKNHDIISLAISENNGVLVKTMGDGTLSYFDKAQDAVRSAVKIQSDINDFNLSRINRTALQVRIGLNTGVGIVEKHDIFGDVVNVASRFETLANPGEIYISESTFNSIEDKDEFYCRFIKTSKLREKKGLFKVFKVFWNKDEAEKDKELRSSEEVSGSAQTITIGQFSKERSALSEEESAALQRAKNLERDNELIELYLLSQEFKVQELEDIHRNLRSELESYNNLEAKFNGENALWFFSGSIIIGRVPESDFHITNKALSRVPIIVGLRDGEGFLKIESRTSGEDTNIEIERPLKTSTVKSGIEYQLGKNGKIIFSVCFPIEYSVYKDKMLILRILDPEECIAKKFNFKLKDVWSNFQEESEKVIVIGK